MKNDFPKWLRVCCWLLPALALAQADHNKLARKKADVFDLKIRVSPADTIACVTQTVDVHISYKNLAGEVLSNFEVHTWFPNELTKYFVFQEVLYAPGNRQPSTDFCRIDHAIWQLGTLQFNQQDSIIYRLHLARRPFRLTTFTYRAEARAGDIHSPQVAASHIFAPKGSGCGEPPDLSIRKSASKNPASVGDEVRFTLTVSNSFADQFNVVVEDFVPAGLAVDTARITPRFDSFQKLADGSHIVRWSFPGRFAAGTSMPLTIPTKVTLNPLDRTGLVNRCKVEGEVTELYCENNYYNFTPPTNPLFIDYLWIDPKYDVRLTFLGDPQGPIEPGKPETYQLAITNLSTVWVENLTLQLDIDDALFDRDCYTIQQPISDGGVAVSNTHVRWHISRLDSAETDTVSLTLLYDKFQHTERGQKVKFVAKIDAEFQRDCGQILFFSVNCKDLNPADNTAKWERTKDFDIDLVLDPAPENNRPDASFDVTRSYHLIVRNVSKVALPLTFLHAKLNPLPGTDPNRIVINGVNGVRPIPSWTIRPLAADDSSSNELNISIDAICDAGTYGFTIEAWIDSVPNESDTTNNRRTWQTKVQPKYDLQLAFPGDSVKRITPGMEEPYALEVKNLSTLRVDSVMLVLAIDDGLPDRNCYSIKPGGVDEVSASEDTLRWLIRLLDPGKTVTRSVTLKYDKLDSLKLGQSVHFVATADSVFCNLTDANPADNTDRWLRTKAEYFDLVLHPAPENNRSGAHFEMPETYRLTVVNASTDSVPATTLHVKLTSLDPRGPELIDIRVDGMRISDLDTSWALPALASNQIEKRSLDVTVHAPQDSGRYCFQMVAWVDTLANESDSTNNRREWETCVTPVYDVRLRFTGEKQGQIRPNQPESYELQVINLSTFRVDSVSLVLNINDALANSNCYSIIGNNDGGIPSSDSVKVEWVIDTLAAGDTATRSLALLYDKIEFSGLGKSVSFTAKVDTLLQGQPDQNPSDNTADWMRTKSFTIDIELDSLESNNRPQASFDVPEKYQLIVKNNSEVTTPAFMLHVNLDLQAFGETVRSRIAIDGVSNLLEKSWPIPPLAPGASDTVELTVTIAEHDRSGIYGFDMIATADVLPGERVTANNRRVWRTAVVAAFDLQLAFLGDSLKQVGPDSVEKYELKIRNLSKFRVERTLLKVKIDDGMAGSNCYRIKDISAGGTASPGGQVVQWLIETLAPVDSITRYVELEYNNIQYTDLGKKVVFTAEIDTLYRGERDKTPADNFDRWERMKQFPLDLVLAPADSNDRPQAQFDTRYPYRLTVKNVSAVQVPSTTLNVELIPYPTTLPDGIDMRVEGMRVSDLDTSWVIPALAPNDSATRFFDAAIAADSQPGDYGFTMHAWIDTLANESDSTNNRRQWQTTVRHHPGFDLVLDFDGAKLDTIGPGAEEPYKLAVTNLSTFRVDSARLELRIDDGMPERNCYRIEDISHAGVSVSDTLVRWQLGPLEPGAMDSSSLKLVYNTIELSDLGKRVEFFAIIDTVYAGLRDQNPGDNIENWERIKDFKIDLALDPTPANHHPNAGFNAPESYRLIVSNASDVSLSDLKLCVKLEPLPGTPRERIQIPPNPPGNLDTCWTSAALAPNATLERELGIVILAHDCPDSGTYGFTMTAWVDTVAGESDTNNNRRAWLTKALLKYDVQLAFLGNSTGSISPGQVEPYELVVRNLSSIRLDSVSLLLTIDDGMETSDCYTIQDSDGGDTLTSGQVRWVIPALASRDSVKKTLTLNYNKIEASNWGQRVQFAAQLDTLLCGRPDQNPADNTKSWERIKDFNLDLVLEPIPANNRPNAAFNVPEPYRFVVRNASDVPLADLKLCIQLEPLPGTPSERIQILSNPPGDLDTCWTIAALAPNAALERELGIVILAQDCPDSGTYGFTMTAWVDTVANESDSTNNRWIWQTTVRLEYDVQLAFLGDSTGSIRPGQVEPYELVVRNRSSIGLDSLSLKLTIDDGVDTSNCYTITDVSDDGDTLTSGQVRWLIASLPPLDSVKKTLTLNYNKIEASDWGRRVHFLAQLDTLLCRWPDQNPADNETSWTRTKDFTFDLAIDSAPENERQTCFDTPEQYHVTVRNVSDVLIRHVKLRVNLLPFDNTSGGRIEIPGTAGLDTSWTIDSLAARATDTRTFTVTIAPHDDPGTYGFTMRACAEIIAGESDTANNCREWKTTVTSEARLSMTPIALTPAQFKFADTLTYSFRYKNESTCNFIVRDATSRLKIPEGTTFLSGTAKTPAGEIELKPDTSMALGDLPPGFAGEATIKLRVFNREDLLDKFRNQASINLVFEATISSRNAGTVSQSRTDMLAIPAFAEAFYLSHNLFRPGLDNAVELYIDVIDNTAVRFKIYNLAGELVRSFPPQPARIGGRVSALWDGRNDRGDYVGSGLYFVFAEVDYKRERPSRRLVVVR